jgi:hypothetical protein
MTRTNTHAYGPDKSQTVVADSTVVSFKDRTSDT